MNSIAIRGIITLAETNRKRGVLLLNAVGNHNIMLWAKRPSCVDSRPAIRLSNDGKHKKGALLMACGIYSITHDASGKVYIGSSSDIERRWKDHINKLRQNRHVNKYLQRSWNKYGEEAFSFGILDLCGESELLEKEQWYLLNSQLDLFNIASDASAPMKGKKHTEETRQKISRGLMGNILTLGYKHTEETRQKMSDSKKGKPQVGGVESHTEEAKTKISESLAGRAVSFFARQKIAEAKKKRVAQLDPQTGEVIRIWDSQTEAAEAVGSDQRAISKVCNQRVRVIRGRSYTAKTAGGYVWRFADED